MAITIIKDTSFNSVPASKIVLPLRKTINLKIKADGTIMNEDGSSLSVLDLGMQGDDCATILHFDLEDLYISGLLRYEVDASTQLLTDYYTPVLYCEIDGDNSNLMGIEFDGVNFYVPSELSSVSQNIKFLYVLKELYRGVDNADNIPNEIEAFVSSEFKGKFQKNLLLKMIDLIEIKNPIENESVTLKKPTINLIFDKDKQLKIDSVGNQRLGYAQDNLITDITIGGLHADEPITYTVFFWNVDNYGIVGATANAEDRLWIPQEVTQFFGVYNIMVHAATENGEQLYSNIIKMEVVRNFLHNKALVNLSTTVKTEDNETIFVLSEE